MVASPVIVKSKKYRFERLYDYVKQFDISSEVLKRGRRILGGRKYLSFSALPMRRFPRFRQFSTFLSRRRIFDLAENSRIEKIYYDRRMNAFANVMVSGKDVYEWRVKGQKFRATSTGATRNIVGAHIANNKGYNGEGVKVGIVDTGCSRVQEQERRANFETVLPTQRADGNGHGGWCTSCVGGRRESDERLSRRVGATVRCEGMAPRCDLLAVKALGYIVGTGSTSGILDAMHLAVDRGSKIVSMSLGGKAVEDSPEDSPYYEAFEQFKSEGVIPVVAAGNNGPGRGTINAPGNLPNCLTVGALNELDGGIAEFSSRGPTNWGDTKPDCVAPGFNIISGLTGSLDRVDGIRRGYSSLSGTSMATPHVSGLVALMSQAHRDVTGEELQLSHIKDMLSRFGKTKNNTRGHGLITWSMYEKYLESQYNISL